MRALITGITGQDGYFLSRLLLSNGYEVWGLARSCVSGEGDLDNRISYVSGDLGNTYSIQQAIAHCRPDEVYNLGAQSHVGISFKIPVETMDVGGLGLVRILEALRHFKLDKTRVYQASTSEMFGNSPGPQNEDTPFDPRSPYAAAKLLAHQTAKVYRESYGMHVSCGILFNHESEVRPETFVTRKITKAAARIRVALNQGKEPKKLQLGNIKAHRDWGYAGDYVHAMWMMLQQDKPDDYVIATGKTHSIADFLDLAFSAVELDWREWTVTLPALKRPNEVNYLCGDASKAREKLGWKPTHSFNRLVKLMIDHDVVT